MHRSPVSPVTGRRCSSLTLLVALAASPAWAKKLTLPQLLEMARGNPGLQANAAATAAIGGAGDRGEAELAAAGRPAVAPGAVARTSVLQHLRRPAARRHCVQTTSPEASLSDVSWNQVFTRTEVKLIQPMYDFGKISAGIAAAEAGVGVSRQREAGARADLELNVRKAYYGLKFARDVHRHARRGVGLRRRRARRSSTRISPTGPATSASPTSCACARCAPSWTRASWRRSACRGSRATACARCSGPRRPPTSTSTTSRSSRPRSRSAPSPTTRTWRARTGPRCGCSSTRSRRSTRSPISSGARSIPTSC